MQNAESSLNDELASGHGFRIFLTAGYQGHDQYEHNDHQTYHMVCSSSTRLASPQKKGVLDVSCCIATAQQVDMVAINC